jgi:predicted membrane-bound mannosyltransferase
MYEFVPLLFSLMAMLYFLVRSLVTRPEQAIPHPLPVQASDEETTPTNGRLPLQEPLLPSSASDTRFVAFLILWTFSTLFIYSWAGEKMPWLVVHPVLPMIVLTGKFAGDLFQEVDWRAVWQRGGALLALLLPITLFGLYTLIKLQPFQGLSIFKLQETGNWLAALLVTLLLVVLTAYVVRRLGARYTILVTLGTLLIFLSLFTVRFAWMATYINYDYATELLVYAHGGADVKPTMDEIAEISRRTAGDKMIEVAYDSDVSWPLEWYMREYPNRKFYGEQPTRENLDVPIIATPKSGRSCGRFSTFVSTRVRPMTGITCTTCPCISARM